jgi:HEAT repeat protein
MGTSSAHTLELKSDPRPAAALFAILRQADREAEAYWEACAVLQHRLPQVFGQIENLAQSPLPGDRETAANLLGQNACAEKEARESCVERLRLLLSHEKMPQVLAAALQALGHLKDPTTLSLRLSFHAHHDLAVRQAAAFSLLGQEDPQAIAALVRLADDGDRDIRNWAVFGLGSMVEADTPALRDALAARLDDLDAEIREEALIGLARRADPRAIPLLRAAFCAAAFPSPLVREAAESLSARTDLNAAWHPLIAEINARGRP